MPQTIMDDAFIGPYEIPTLEDFHAGVPVPGESSNVLCRSKHKTYACGIEMPHCPVHRLHRAS